MKNFTVQGLHFVRFTVGLFCGALVFSHSLLLVETLFTLPENWGLLVVVHVSIILIFGFITDWCFKNKNEKPEEKAKN